MWLLLVACVSPLPSPRLAAPVWSSPTALGAGASFALADLDRDGRRDLIFGAPSEAGSGRIGLQTWRGLAGAAFEPAASLMAPAQITSFGISVDACDLDQDGWQEIVVGEPGWPDCAVGRVTTCPEEASRGRVSVYAWGAHGLDATPILELTGAPGDELGLRVDCGHDLDRDGYPDLVASAPRARDARGNEGLVSLWRGGPDGLDPVPASGVGQQGLWAGEGEDIALADMNGDGWTDLLTGAPDWDGDQPDEGRVALYLNGPGGLQTSPAQSWEGGVRLGRAGSAIAAGGDVNGDGYADLLIGAPGVDHEGMEAAGRAELFLGGPQGPAASAAWSVHGGIALERLGFTVDLADRDGDRWSDVLVGATVTPFGAGGAVLRTWPGSPAGPVSQQLPRWVGINPQSRVGWQVANTGDLDGDGVDELLIGLRATGGAGLDLHLGRPSGWDGDGDGLSLQDDCDDADPLRRERQPELVADGVDGDCDGQELCYADQDGDGHGASGSPLRSADLDCADLGESALADDCDDGAGDRWPGAPEIPGDGRLQGCGTTELCWVDADGDGYPVPTTQASADADCDDPGEAPIARQTYALTDVELGARVAASGDLDGDGLLDMVVSAYAGLRHRDELWALQQAPWTLRQQASRGWQSGAVGDLDADGIAEVAWLSGLQYQRQDGDSSVLHVLRDGEVVFAQPISRSLCCLVSEAGLSVTPDMDGDGYGELAMSFRAALAGPSGTSPVLVLRGGPDVVRWDRAWALPMAATPASAPTLAAADFDGDGLGDLAALVEVGGGAVRFSGELLVWYGGTSGPVAAAPAQRGRPDLSRQMVTGDLDGDGFDDLVIGVDGGMSSSLLEWYRGGPVGLGAHPTTTISLLALGGKLRALAAPGDLDGDGFGDLVVSTASGRAPVVLPGSLAGVRGGLSHFGVDEVRAEELVPAGLQPGLSGPSLWSVSTRGSRARGELARFDLRHLAEDCDDGDAGRHAAAWDRPGDGIDQDCDGYDTCWVDLDEDCWPDPDRRVTPDLTRACSGPGELAGAAPSWAERVGTLARLPAERRCRVAGP